MNMFEDVKTLVVKRAEVCKKIRLDTSVIQKCVDKLFKYISYFNSIEEFDAYVFNYHTFDEVMIPSEFAGFVIPKSVKYVPGLRQSVDVLVRSKVPEGETFTINEWIDICVEWRSFFKKDFRTDVTPLSTLKVDKSLVDVLPIACYHVPCEADKKGNVTEWESYVRYEGSPFIPLVLNEVPCMYLYRSDYYNASYEEVINDYLSTQIYN